MPSEDCPKKQRIKKQGRLKAKLEEKTALEKKMQADKERKRQQALQFLSVLQENLLDGGDKGILDAIDAIFQILEWEKQFIQHPQEAKERIKIHFTFALPNYREALRISMENQIAAQRAAQEITHE